jgi:hypothetical protein
LVYYQGKALYFSQLRKAKMLLSEENIKQLKELVDTLGLELSKQFVFVCS